MINSIKNYFTKYTGLLIRFDDIVPNMNWSLMNKCENLFDKYNIKPLLGIIPQNQDKELQAYKKNENFWDQARTWQKKGWEISMHGFSHVYDRETNRKDYFGYGGRSEFFGRDFETQEMRIRKGLQVFRDEKINIRSFFAPNHTCDKFEKFIKKNHDKIINFDQCIEKVNNSYFTKLINFTTKNMVKGIRLLR
jgi:predicted deacetylase